jgi:hypothetical protein
VFFASLWLHFRWFSAGDTRKSYWKEEVDTYLYRYHTFLIRLGDAEVPFNL